MTCVFLWYELFFFFFCVCVCVCFLCYEPCFFLCFFVIWIVFFFVLFFCGMIFFCAFLWYELCIFLCLFFVVWIVFFFGAFFVVWIVFFLVLFLVVWIVFFFAFLWYELCFFLCFFLWYKLFFFLCFCGMNCVFLCFFLWYELCFFLAFFVAWVVFFLCFFFWCFLAIENKLDNSFPSQFQGRTGWKHAWFVFFFFLCLFLWYELCFFFFVCFFFLWYELCFFLVLFLWYELCFLWYELCFFFVLFFCGMNCVFFCAFFLWYELCFFFVLFLVVWIVFFCFFFVCSGAPEKNKTKHKKHEKCMKKAQFLWKKMNLRPPGLDSLWTSGPANVSRHFLFSNLFSKKHFQEWSHARSGNVKKCNYHMMFMKNLNNYCWRHAFVTLFTYNLQWLDRLMAVSRYLRYAAFNIVKNVMIHNIVSSYRWNTLHHHTISLPLLFDTQIFR